MDFFEKYEKKYLPDFHSARYTRRLQEALKLKAKALENPKDLSWE